MLLLRVLPTSQGRGLPASLSASLRPTRHHTPQHLADKDCLWDPLFCGFFLNHRVCLRSRQMILETTCAILLPYNICFQMVNQLG